MGKYLNVERWFVRKPTGKLQRKRVSAVMEKQFPLELRKIYQEGGASGLVAHLIKAGKYPTLSMAWDAVKKMFNN